MNLENIELREAVVKDHMLNGYIHMNCLEQAVSRDSK